MPTTGNLIELTAAFMLQIKMSAHSNEDNGQPTGPDSQLSLKDILQNSIFSLDKVIINSKPRLSQSQQRVTFCSTITASLSKQNVLSWPHLNDMEIIIKVGLIGIH